VIGWDMVFFWISIGASAYCVLLAIVC